MVFNTWTVFILICLFASLYKYLTRNDDYFKDKPFPSLKSIPLFGNMFRVFTKQISAFDYGLDMYNRHPEAKFMGYFDVTAPSILIRDPESIKKIGVKDFEYFIDHRHFTTDDDPGDSLFGNSLFLLTGQKWKDMRATLSPAFTGSKMRQMFELISTCSQNVTNYYQDQIKTKGQEILEMKDTFTRFASDVIATTAFGFDVDSFHNRDNEFFQLGKDMINMNNPILMLKFLIIFLSPKLAKKLGVDLMPAKWTNHFKQMILEAFEHRDKNNIIRNDMVNILLQLRKGQQIKNQVEDKDEEVGFAIVEESAVGKRLITRKWTDNELISQLFLFFMAGFDTVSTVMTFLSYELALNPEIQQKLYEEIKEVNGNMNGKQISYDAVQKMQYMDMVVSESLRLWPPVPFVDRYCVKDYTYEDEEMKFNIKKGQLVSFPIAGLHRDPKYYHNPEKFDPERFSLENKKKINMNAYLPFGVGPRNCIGCRFALIEVKILMCYLLLSFSFMVTEKTPVPMVLVKNFSGPAAKDGLYLELRSRK